ncbi:proton-coupled folate transporter-like [Montipora foliosa]|uniref:proton-coupled folate transporter-like n=1 Tax=Montipora foliosa TaxID=591990 RepID=UPI0035F1E28C
MPRHNLPVWRRYLTVEPVLFFYAYGFFSAFPLYLQYAYSVLSEQNGFPYKEVTAVGDGLGCQESIIAQNDTLKQLEKEVQSQATRLDLALVFFETIPSLLLAPFWGGWSDKSGRRKPALLFPSIGAILGTIVMLTVMHLKLPLYVMFVGSAISGLSGFLTVLSIAVMSYTVDTTEKTAIAILFAREFLSPFGKTTLWKGKLVRAQKLNQQPAVTYDIGNRDFVIKKNKLNTSAAMDIFLVALLFLHGLNIHDKH